MNRPAVLAGCREFGALPATVADALAAILTTPFEWLRGNKRLSGALSRVHYTFCPQFPRRSLMANPRRVIADCRLFPNAKNCTLTISGMEEEVLTIAVQHAVASHGHKDSPELRTQIRSMHGEEK